MSYSKRRTNAFVLAQKQVNQRILDSIVLVKRRFATTVDNFTSERTFLWETNIKLELEELQRYFPFLRVGVFSVFYYCRVSTHRRLRRTFERLREL